MSESSLEAPEVASEEQDGRKGAARVVLRAVQAVVLDDLPLSVRGKVFAVLGEGAEGEAREAWVAVAARTGTIAGAITEYAGRSGDADALPGTYKAVPAGSWFVSPLVVEPPLG